MATRPASSHMRYHQKWTLFPDIGRAGLWRALVLLAGDPILVAVEPRVPGHRSAEDRVAPPEVRDRLVAGLDFVSGASRPTPWRYLLLKFVQFLYRRGIALAALGEVACVNLATTES